MHALKRALFGCEHVAHDVACEMRDHVLDERIHEADQRLHDQATRLHVLEWEAYGRKSKRSEDH